MRSFRHPVFCITTDVMNVSITAAIHAAGLFALLVIVMALFGKLIGGFVGSRIAGFDSYDSLIFGVGVMPRAGIELVVISAGRSMGIIGDEIFSAIVLMVAVSVIVSPVLLKFAIGPSERRITPEPTARQA